MSYLLTLALTVAILGVVVMILARVRTPRYRLDRDNVARLLRMVLDGRATSNDWNVFTTMPIRHDPTLEDLRRRCLAIEARHFLGDPTPGRRHLFTAAGLREIDALLAQIECDQER